jgi:hypothetical protein
MNRASARSIRAASSTEPKRGRRAGDIAGHGTGSKGYMLRIRKYRIISGVLRMAT